MITLTAKSYVPFEPKLAEQAETRRVLREALRGLVAPAGHVLYGALDGHLPPGVDVENALFYNLDAAGVFQAMRSGVLFEVAQLGLNAGVRFEYDVVPTATGFRYWRAHGELAAFDALRVPRLTLADMWWAMRSSRLLVAGERKPADPFIVDLRLAGPKPGLTPGLLKTALDGVICGLQRELVEENAAAAASVIAQAVAATVSDVEESLTRGLAALGGKRRLVHLWRKGVKWEPDDHQCVAARVLYETAPHWELAASIHRATPSNKERS